MSEGPIPPGSTIGILGGGQLGRMLAMAAARLGLRTHVFSDEADAPAFDVAAVRSVGSYADGDAIARFAGSVDVVTCEFENVPAATLQAASRVVSVFPPANAFAVAQDRRAEKDFVTARGIPVAPYAPVDSLDDLTSALPRGANVYGLGEAVASSGFRRDVGTDGPGTIQTMWARDIADPIDQNLCDVA